MMEQMKNYVICPRCGSIGTLSKFTVRGREYYRVLHGRTTHYIGPCDEYVHVNHMFENSFGGHLSLQNLAENNPIDNAIAALRLLKNEKLLKILARKRDELIQKLEHLKKIVEEIESELMAME